MRSWKSCKLGLHRGSALSSAWPRVLGRQGASLPPAGLFPKDSGEVRVGGTLASESGPGLSGKGVLAVGWLRRGRLESSGLSSCAPGFESNPGVSPEALGPRSGLGSKPSARRGGATPPRAAGGLSVRRPGRRGPLRTGARRWRRVRGPGVRSPVPEEKAETRVGASYHPAVPARGLAGALCGAEGRECEGSHGLHASL